MYQLIKPKFKFELFLSEGSKNGSFYKNQNQRVLCFADTYEVHDGSVTFFQSAKTSSDKFIRIPVLSYPPGKWEALALVDDNSCYPVFNYSSQASIGYADTPSNKSDEIDTRNTSADGLDSGQQRNPLGGTYTPNQGHNNNFAGFNNNMPGINNPQEFKKAKNDWLEKAIKDYVKTVEFFKSSEFIKHLQKDSIAKQYKPTDTDVDWTASSLIRDRMVVSRKFSEPPIQKTLSLILPDIMKRQWNGKMAIILEILHAKEEAKNVTAIDLAVWMAQNNVT